MQKESTLGDVSENIECCVLDFRECFSEEEENRSISFAAVYALTNVLRRSREQTIQGVMAELKLASEQMLTISVKENLLSFTRMPLQAACDIFRHMVNKEFSSKIHEQIEDLKVKLVQKGEEMGSFAIESRARVSDFAIEFIRDGVTLLVHGYSRVVEHLLIEAARKGVRYNVTVTEARPENSGYAMKKSLEQYDVPVNIVLDSAVGCVIEDIDYVLVGAEAVVENGGIINKIGTLSIAMCAKNFKKPFYVATESLKFIRSFPLSQADVSEMLGIKCEHFDHPVADFTPPEYITLLFTDLGIFTPSAVSDELIQFYSN